MLWVSLGSGNAKAEREGCLCAVTKRELVKIAPSEASFMHEGHPEGHEQCGEVGMGGEVREKHGSYVLRQKGSFGMSSRGMCTDYGISY